MRNAQRPAVIQALHGDAPSLVQRAYECIEQLIVTLALAPGQVVSEAILAKTIGLGRTPVREALQRLAREGLVEILPKRGVVVSRIDIARQLRMLEFRRPVEQFLVRAATRRAAEPARTRLKALARRFRAVATAADPADFLSADIAFSEELARTAENEFAAAAMTLMHGLSRRFGYAFDPQLVSIPVIALLHATLADAIAAGDEAKALASLQDLLDQVERFTREALESR